MRTNPLRTVLTAVKDLLSNSDPTTQSGLELPASGGPTETQVRTGLSGEEVISRLLRRNGGRMHQKGVVETTGWSASTVSRLLSGMEERGTVVRTRVGRGKVVGVPERMPAPASEPATEAAPDGSTPDPERPLARPPSGRPLLRTG